jgi:outer membrane protein assembly factor BamB
MKFTFSLSTVILIAILYGCSWFKNEDKIQKYGKLRIIWRESFNSDQLYGSSTPAFFSDKVVFSNYPAFGTESFFALNADKGGKEYWRWEDYINENDKNVGSESLPIMLNNILCITPANGTIGVDIQTGETLWKDHFSSPGFTGKFERSVIRQGQTGSNKAFIRLTDIETGKGRNVFEIDTITTPYFAFTTPIVYRDAVGDTLLYCSFGEAFQQLDGSLISNVKFFAYNITKNKMIWEKEGMSATGLIDNDRLYVISDSLYELDLKTGNRIWANKKYENMGKFIQISEDKIIITGDGAASHIQAFNKSDGSFIWGIPFNGGASEPAYHKGLMYFTCGSDGLLWAIRVSNGEIVWKERCPDLEQDSDSFWSFGVNVDPVRNKLYVASYTGAFCLEPAE